MGLVSTMSRKDFPLLDYEDATAALAGNLYLLLNRDKIAKLNLETVDATLHAKTLSLNQPLVNGRILNKNHQGG
ncbi:MAG TPA: hypothetical protein VLX12_01880 [Syntrophorhabdales bacterium]|nr:hypothetical protein [Syntrophorhabdales bacterium]